MGRWRDSANLACRAWLFVCPSVCPSVRLSVVGQWCLGRIKGRLVGQVKQARRWMQCAMFAAGKVRVGCKNKDKERTKLVSSCARSRH